MSDTVENQKSEPTEAELKAYRENMKKFYDDQIPLLKKQKEYEMLLADIEEARAKRITMTVRIAQIMAGPPKEQEEESNEAPQAEAEQPTPRKLKKEEA